MFNLFKKEVISCYEDRRSQGKLSVELENPSPAKLRSYILARYLRGDLQSDSDTLAEIFNPNRRHAELETAIEKFETDKLRALQYLMIGRTSEPKEIFVKLLAIAIDFQPRPFQKWREAYEAKKTLGNPQVDAHETADNPPENEQINPTAEEIEHDEIIYEQKETTTAVEKQTESPVEQENKTIKKQPIKTKIFRPFFVGKNRFIFRSVAFMLLITGTFTTIYLLTPKQCMCWIEDRYIAVDCSDKSQTTPVIALNENIENFKKIMRPDTLTEAYANRVWYSKINHEVEFFTTAGSGFHPLTKNRSLKVATSHILEKYAGSNANAIQPNDFVDN